MGIRNIFKRLIAKYKLESSPAFDYRNINTKNITKGNTMINGPYFIGVGVPKAGTSWWYNLLLEHPSIVSNLSGEKEIHFFSHFGFNKINEDALENYKGLFPNDRGEVSGEWSPGYFWHPFALKNISKLLPEVKILIILRNPIYRTLSHYNHILRHRTNILGIARSKEQFFKMSVIYPESIYCSFYDKIINNIYNIFPKDNVLLLQYESCVQNTENELKKTYEFLDMSYSYVPCEINRKINKSKKYSVNKEVVNRLRNYFYNDVIELTKNYEDIDLNLWKEFT